LAELTIGAPLGKESANAWVFHATSMTRDAALAVKFIINHDIHHDASITRRLSVSLPSFCLFSSLTCIDV
jgi:hypothetical protein